MAKDLIPVNDDGPQPVRGERGAPILGPRNIPLERQNPDLLASPYTDAGTIPNLPMMNGNTTSQGERR